LRLRRGELGLASGRFSRPLGKLLLRRGELGLLGLASGRLALELHGALGKLFPCVLDDSFFLRDGLLKLSGTFLLQQRLVDATIGQSPQCQTSTHDHQAETRLLIFILFISGRCSCTAGKASRTRAVSTHAGTRGHVRTYCRACRLTRIRSMRFNANSRFAFVLSSSARSSLQIYSGTDGCTACICRRGMHHHGARGHWGRRIQLVLVDRRGRRVEERL
jgi:hypothetical protein